MVPVEVSIPDWPYDSLQLILFAEGAAAFEELTLTHGVDQLKMQVPDAWPNSFRQARFLSAVDFVQADRFRRKVANGDGARLLPGGSAAGSLPARRDAHHHQLHRAIPRSPCARGSSRFRRRAATGRPIRANPPAKFSPPRRVPHGVTLIGRLFDEGRLGSAGLALERSFGVAGRAAAGVLDARSRFHPRGGTYRGAGRALLRHDAGRLRRRCHQGGAQADRRPVAQLGTSVRGQ